MANLKQIKPDQVSGGLKDNYDAFQKKFGKVPNIFQYMGNFPEMIQAHINMSKSLEKGTLSAALREKITLAVSQSTQCHYCLAVLTHIGLKEGLKEEDTVNARLGKSSDKKEEIILQFAKKLIDKKGSTSREDFDQLKSVGVNDQQACEIFMTVMATLIPIYFNNFNETPLDFPEACKIDASAMG